MFPLFRQPSALRESLSYQLGFSLFLGLVVTLVVHSQMPDSPVSAYREWADAVICGLTAILVFSGQLSILPYLFGSWFSPDRWTIGRDLLFSSWVFFVVGVVNSLMLVYLGWMQFQWSGFFWQQFLQLAWGLPPISLMVVWRNQKYAALNMAWSKQIEEKIEERGSLALGPSPELLRLQAAQRPLGLPAPQKREGPKLLVYHQGEAKGIFLEDILALYSQKGELDIYWAEAGQLAYIKVQMRLKDTQEALAQQTILHRVHRFYWANLARVTTTESNARHILLSLPQLPQSIPVSKTYRKAVQDYFEMD